MNTISSFLPPSLSLYSKSTSLAPATRLGLVQAIAQSIGGLVNILQTAALDEGSSETSVPQPFRDAWACHVYMLYTFLFLFESQIKGSDEASGRKQHQEDDCGSSPSQLRSIAANAMLQAAKAMAKHRTTLWKRGVPDETVVLLPSRIAYTWLEASTGVLARKTACGDEALQILAVTLDGSKHSASILNTVTAALMDLMHSFEHMAPLAAELCTTVADDRLAVELLRELGRLDTSNTISNKTGTGIKNVAPFVSNLAVVRPRLVLQHLAHLLPHLEAEPYNLRSAIVTAVGHILAAKMTTTNSHQGETTTAEHSTEAEEEKENDDGSQPAKPAVSNKSMDTLLDLLTERVYDVSSYTRATVLKAWIHLVHEQVLPKERVLSVTGIAMDRLQDKTVMVRKQAMQLLTVLLENNPYMGNLDPAPYQRKLKELYLFVKSNLPSDIAEAHAAGLAEAEQQGDNEALQELEQAALAAAMAEADVMMQNHTADDLSEMQREFCTKVQALKFTQSALDFIELFEDATVALEGMLLSANTSDVTEALRFFVQARHFQLPCAVTGMKRALALMWSSEAAIRNEVLKAFVDVFIAEPGSDGARPLADNEIAKNLLVLTGQATVSELASIEEAMVRLVKEERIPADVFLVLWSIASQGSGEARAAAIQLLSMGAQADRSILDSKSRLKLLLEAGLGDYTEEHKDWRLATSAAVALQRISRAKYDPSDAKYLVLERLMEQSATVAQGSWCVDDEPSDTLQWFAASEQAIQALFVISPEPETVCRAIIADMHRTTFETDTCHSLRLARFFHVLGQISLHLLVYTEALSGNVRRANGKRTLRKQEEADNAKASKSNTDNDEEDDAIEAELGMAQEAEAENERKLADISEQEILNRGLISKFGPLLVRVVGNEGGRFFDSEILMQASVLALCKFMCVSSSFCEKHLPLLFTALANAPAGDTTLRANTVVALGDLAFRFPNEVEPYTPRLYACLRDSSTKVRRHTLMVLTHLILNDMVKVKGQVCEIALCLRDEDSRIRDMSRLLFHELSKRSNNPVYNLLPDIISQLSQLSIAREDFRSIMGFLLSYIKKERQNEMLTEKLCQRFPKCTSMSQKGDLAYCISQLKMNEKSIKCLSDNFKLYKDALFDEDVNRSFVSIVTKAKKFMKPEMRQFLEEWESKLSESAEVGAENQLAGEKAARAKAKARRRATRKKKPLASIQDEEEEGETVLP